MLIFERGDSPRLSPRLILIFESHSSEIRMTSRGLWVRSCMVFALVVVLAATGCGQKTNKVKGKVTYDGKTVVWGSVTLLDAKGAYHQGDIDLNGNYEIANVPVGPVKIGVVSPDPKVEAGGSKGGKGGNRDAAAAGGAKTSGGGAAASDDPRERFFQQQGGRPQAPEKPKPQPGQWFPIPAKFTDPATSGLSGEVKPGTDLNIDLPK